MDSMGVYNLIQPPNDPTSSGHQDTRSVHQGIHDASVWPEDVAAVIIGKNGGENPLGWRPLLTQPMDPEKNSLELYFPY